jgi:hypothetical protein
LLRNNAFVKRPPHPPSRSKICLALSRKGNVSTDSANRIPMKCQIPRQHGLGMRSGACAAARPAFGWSILSSCHRARRQRMSRRKDEIRQSRPRSDRFQLPAPVDQVHVRGSRCGHSDGRRPGSEVGLERLALRFERGLLAGAELGSRPGRQTTREDLVDVPSLRC